MPNHSYFSRVTRRVGFTLIELMVVVAIIAVLAVTAVPQFTKYMRSAKAAEATMMLADLRKGSAAYYTVPHADALTGKRRPCQFPGKAPLTPSAASCCVDAVDADNDERCDAAPQRWDNPQWSALKFAITDAHFFQYEYDSSGTLAKARSVAGAHADLDCDGVLSTFEVAMVGDPNATDAECDAVDAAGFFRDNETE